MPELPEVETSRRGIEPHLVGATILHAVVRNGRLRWPVSEEIYRLSDTPVLSVQRRAKIPAAGAAGRLDHYPSGHVRQPAHPHRRAAAGKA